MDQMMLEPARFAAGEFARQGLPAWEFRFDYVGDVLRARSPNGAPHASEIPFVFDKYGAGYIAMVSPTHSGEASAEDKAVAAMVHRYWVNFAKTGDPNGQGLPPWPKYDSAKDELLIVRSPGVSRYRWRTAQVSSVDASSIAMISIAPRGRSCARTLSRRLSVLNTRR